MSILNTPGSDKVAWS